MSYHDDFKQRPYPDNDGNSHDIEFLPCPFCLSAPYVFSIGNCHTKSRSVRVKCKTCRIERKDSAITHGFAWLYKVAAKNWNQRPHPDDQPFDRTIDDRNEFITGYRDRKRAELNNPESLALPMNTDLDVNLSN